MSSNLIEIIGVYDADSTLIGEVSYWVKARFGVAHCALCDLTHGMFTKRRDWTECTTSLGVPVRTFHRNDAPADVLACATELPAVLARTADELRVIITPTQLEEFAGNTERFVAWLAEFVRS